MFIFKKYFLAKKSFEKAISQKGLNIAELTVAIGIMAIAVMTITGMFMAGVMGMKKGDKVIMATNLLQSSVELYENEILDDFNSYNAGIVYNLPDVMYDNVSFQRKMYIKNRGNALTDKHPASNKLIEMQMSIYWYDKDIGGKTWQKPKDLTFTTVLTNYRECPVRTPTP